MRIMVSINPLENWRLYISSRPPLVVFMISVSAMAIAFLTLGYFFKIKEIKSPEMTEVQLHLEACLPSQWLTVTWVTLPGSVGQLQWGAAAFGVCS
jgi:hypothetical protein